MFGAGGIHSVWRPRARPPFLARVFSCWRRPLRAFDRLARNPPTLAELDEPVAPGYVLGPGPTLGARLSCIAARSALRSGGLPPAQLSLGATHDLAIPLPDRSHNRGMPVLAAAKPRVSRRGFERSPHVSKAAGSGIPVSATEGFVLRAGESAGRRGGLARRRSWGAARARRTLRSRTIVRYASRTEGFVGRAPRVPARRRGMAPALPYSRRGAPSPR